MYDSSGGGRRGVDGGGSSTELHIHRADTRELTAKSSWFCHLLHVSLVGVVAVSYGARRAGTNQPPAASNNARPPRPQQPPRPLRGHALPDTTFRGLIRWFLGSRCLVVLAAVVVLAAMVVVALVVCVL